MHDRVFHAGVAAVAGLVLSCAGVLRAETILFDAKSGTFCLERPALPDPAAQEAPTCVTQLTGAVTFESGEVVYLKIINARLASDYEVTVDNKTIQVQGMQFRPPLSAPITPPSGAVLDEEVRVFQSKSESFALPGESETNNKNLDVAALVARMATATGIEEIRLEVRRARESAVNSQERLTGEKTKAVEELTALRGTSTEECKAAALGDTLNRLDTLVSCDEKNLKAMAKPPSRNDLAALSVKISDLSDRANLFEKKLSASNAATTVATLQMTTATAHDSIAEYSVAFSRILAAIKIARAQASIPDAERELAVAEYRNRVKALVPGISDAELKPILEKFRAQLQKRDELFRTAINADVKALLGLIGSLGRQTDQSAALKELIERLVTAARDESEGPAQFAQMAERIEAEVRTVFTGPERDTALARAHGIRETITQQAAATLRNSTNLDSLRKDVDDAVKTIGELDLKVTVPFDEAKKELKTFNSETNAFKGKLDTLFRSVNELYDTERAEPTRHLVGQWMQNTLVEVKATEKVKYTTFGRIASGSGGAAGASDGAGGAASAAAPNGARAGLDPSVALVRTMTFEVHQMVRWKVIAGFVGSTLRERTWDLRNREVKDASGSTAIDANGNPKTENIMVRKEDDRPQLHYLLGPAIYLKRRDLYPGALKPIDRIMPALLVGMALNDAKQYFFGPTFEPVTGLDLYFGLHVGREKLPILGLAENSVVPSTYTTAPTRDALRYGVFFGIGFDLNVFRTLFSKPANLANSLP